MMVKTYITICILFSSSLCSLFLNAGTVGECGVTELVVVGDLLVSVLEVDAGCAFVFRVETGFISELFISISLRSPLFILFTAILEKAVTILPSGMCNVITVPHNVQKVLY